MTVSEIRSLMLEKVIPESLLPQNIAVCLMDENAAPPELDAFTFLNRLRSLGIGSADFLYLLKGCGAPEEAVSKIEQHPDMNLQTLIVTLESSGLTPKDYTRMLYTARQLWEHTITMRIDSGELEAAAESRQEEQPEPQDPAGSEESAEQEAPAAEESTPEESAETTEPTEPSEPPRPVRTARQRKRRKEETAPETEPEQPAEVREDSPKARRNAIIAAAAGAAVLFAIDPLMDILGFTAPGSSGGEFQFASDNAAVFSEIYTAYTNGRISSEKTQKLSKNEQIFGDMLINSGKELGVFSSGNTLWSAEPDGISVYALDSGGLAAHVLPPEGAEFVKVVQTDSGVTAVYSGDAKCGLIGVDGSGEIWSCGQSGTLTDIFCGEDIIRLGSVYTPGFTKSFTVDDVLEYLPYGSKNGQLTAFSPAEIAVSGSADGCSYAVWGEYAAENGEQKKRLAALGSPIYSGAESFTAAMTRENGSAELTSDGGSLVSAALPEITACAAGNGVIADAEISDGGVTVYLRDSALKPLAAFTTGGEIDHLRISGNVVYVGSGGSTVMAVDISDTSSPKALDLTSADGVVSGDYALCGAVSKTGITLTLYKLESKKAVQADSFAKALTASEVESFRFSGTNCFVINGTDCSGAAYRYFDGVSVVDEFAELGRSRSLHTLYDDKTGYTGAAVVDGSLKLLSGDKILN